MPEKYKSILRGLVWRLHLSDESRRLFNLYSTFVKKGDLVFDIGANHGNHSDIFLQLGARVVAIEASPELIPVLIKRFRNKKVSIVNKVVASKRGKLKFKIMKSDGVSTFASPSEGRMGDLKKIVEIETTSLPDLIKEYGSPKFIKIDVEGFEYEVIRSIKSKIKIISFEFYKKDFEIARKCITYLKSLGEVTFNISYAKGSKLRFKKWLKDIPNNIEFGSGDIYARYNN